MSKFIGAGLMLIAGLMISSNIHAKNIKVVCKSDAKHDKAKLIKAIRTAKAGDKIVVFGQCKPAGIYKLTTKVYKPLLAGVVLLTTNNVRQYNSWVFDTVVEYDVSYDLAITESTVIDSHSGEITSVTSEEHHEATETSSEEEHHEAVEESDDTSSEAADDEGSDDSSSDDGAADSGYDNSEDSGYEETGDSDYEDSGDSDYDDGGDSGYDDGGDSE